MVVLFDIELQLKQIPEKPGVYLMYDKEDTVIYVGKAKNLKNRVRQYFQNSQANIKVKIMVKKIARFEYIVTNSEIEALVLENNLIKKYYPEYNIRLKDDKTYPYVKITVNEMFPRVFVTRKYLNDKAKYFGPYTNGQVLKESMELIYSLFPIRTCSLKFPRDINKNRPCLNYDIKKCKAPCNKKVSEEEYNQMISKIIDFFSGKYDDIIKELEKEMFKLSENLEFEKAIELRDKIEAIKKIDESQLAENTNTEDKDILAFARADDEAMFQVFFIRNGKMVGREHFLLNGVSYLSRSELMEDFVKQFYSGTAFIPKEIILQEEIEDKETIEKWLSSIKDRKVLITSPKKGDKHKLIEMANQNALISLERFSSRIKSEKQRTIGAIEDISKALNLPYLKRIEAYDISNIQGIDSVGSMIVFEDGKPLRTDYRKFKIKHVTGANDYASMQEVLSRRFLRYINEKEQNFENGKFNKLPDAIFLDGGKGQISAVQCILDSLGLEIPICGMVKDDNHRTRALLYNDKEINFKTSSNAFKLITRIQDEVHRFAIEYHRKSRAKALTRSILDDIENIGEKRKKALLKHFGGIDNIKNASIEELIQVEGMNLRACESVYNFFKK